MKKEIRLRLDQEQLNLFKLCWNKIAAEEKELDDYFNIARNLACSEMTYTCVGLSATKIHYKTMDCLNRNYYKLREEIDRKRYFLLKSFLPVLTKAYGGLSSVQQETFDHWEEELKKPNPNLDDRFRKDEDAER